MFLIFSGMRGKVITRSENLLAHAASWLQSRFLQMQQACLPLICQ